MSSQLFVKYLRAVWAVVVCLSLGSTSLSALARQPSWEPAKQLALLAGSVQLIIDPPAVTVAPNQVFSVQLRNTCRVFCGTALGPAHE